MSSSIKSPGTSLSNRDFQIAYDKLHNSVMVTFGNADSAKSFSEAVQRSLSNYAVEVGNDGVSSAETKPSDDEGNIETQLSIASNEILNKPILSLPNQESPALLELKDTAKQFGKDVIVDSSGNPTGFTTATNVQRDYTAVQDPAMKLLLEDKRKDIAKLNVENKAYFQTDTDSQPIPEGFNIDLCSAGLGHYADLEKYNSLKSEGELIREKRELGNPKNNWVENETIYKQNSCTSNGRTIDYKLRISKVNWGADIASYGVSDPIKSLDLLRKKVTKSIKEGYGGWDRINSIIVRDSCMIINNICFKPLIEPKYLDNGTFPWDVSGYISRGAIAMIFDWWYLKYMTSLSYLDIDDTTLYTSTIDSDLGCRGRIGVVTAFKVCRSLNTLVLGDEAITRDSLYKSDSVPIKTKVASSKRSLNLLQGLQMDITGATNGVQNFFVDSLRNYACNRGNKGMIRYSLGVVARTGGVLTSGAVNLVTHLGKGIFNAIRNAKQVNAENAAHNLGDV